MSFFDLIPPLISAVLYLFLYLKPWRRLKLSNTDSSSPSPNYIIGLSFSIFFYFGLPLWLWRYGWKVTAKIILGCILASLLVPELIDLAIPFDDEEDKYLFSFFIQSPIRVALAIWLANHDALLLKTRKLPNFLTRLKSLFKKTRTTFPSTIEENKTKQKGTTNKKHTKKGTFLATGSTAAGIGLGSYIGGTLSTVTILGSHALGGLAVGLGLASTPVLPLVIGATGGAVIGYASYKLIKHWRKK